MNFFKLFLALIFISPITYANVVKLESVTLLQPNFVYAESGIDAAQIASVIRSTVEEVNQAWENETLPAGFGFIVIALRSNGQLNAWLDIEPELPEAIQNRAIMRIRQSQGPHFEASTIVFAICVSINNGHIDEQKKPFPQAWQKFLSTYASPIEIGELVNLLWPE